MSPYRPLFKETEPVQIKYEFEPEELEEALVEYLADKISLNIEEEDSYHVRFSYTTGHTTVEFHHTKKVV